MKKIFFALFLLFAFYSVSLAATLDRHPVIITTDSADFTTSVNKFWRWLETRIRFNATTDAFIYHSIDFGPDPFASTSSPADESDFDVIIENTTSIATTDTVIYPGATGDTATVFLRDTDELRVRVQGKKPSTARNFITIIGEEI